MEYAKHAGLAVRSSPHLLHEFQSPSTTKQSFIDWFCFTQYLVRPLNQWQECVYSRATTSIENGCSRIYPVIGFDKNLAATYSHTHTHMPKESYTWAQHLITIDGLFTFVFGVFFRAMRCRPNANVAVVCDLCIAGARTRVLVRCFRPEKKRLNECRIRSTAHTQTENLWNYLLDAHSSFAVSSHSKANTKIF